MESITIKVNDEMASEINKAMKPNYSTKTEFIREALRDKMKQIEGDKFLMALKRFQGAAKVHVTDEMLEEAREKALRNYCKERGWKSE